MPVVVSVHATELVLRIFSLLLLWTYILMMNSIYFT